MNDLQAFQSQPATQSGYMSVLGGVPYAQPQPQTNAPVPAASQRPTGHAPRLVPPLPVRLSSISLRNFCRHESVMVDLSHDGYIMPLACLVGPNGTGKTTILEAVMMLCSNFSGYDQIRFRAMMLKRVRNFMHMQSDQELNSADFEVRGRFVAVMPGRDPFEYDVAFTRNGFISLHPPEVAARMIDMCFMARFDQELHTFQVRRDKWPVFQQLFSAVTGFKVEEDDNIFDDSSDEFTRRLIENYVLGFKIVKDREVITHRQCSSGERKIIKCFSTILNKPCPPSIILIDNVTMHIEVGRHIAILDALERCFEDSQIICTCHSEPVSRYLPFRQRLFDMRLITAPDAIRKEPWRLRMFDEVSDAVRRLTLMGCMDDTKPGTEILHRLFKDPDSDKLMDDSLTFLSTVPEKMRHEFRSTPTSKLGPIGWTP